MKITMNNLTLFDLLQILEKFNNVTGKLGYAISRTKSKMVEEARPFQEEHRKLLQKYGTKKEDGTYAVPTETEEFNEFYKEFMAIAEEKVEIDIKQITQEEYDESDVYNKDCTTKDYDLIEAMFVIKDKETDLTKEGE